MDKTEIKENWNRMAETYEEFTSGEDSYSNLIEWRTIKGILPDIKGKSILDLGCGTGRFSFLFEEYKPRKIVGMDISEGMIAIGKKIAEKRGSIVTFLNKDAESLSEIEASSFDFIFSSTMLHYIKDLDNVLKEIYRLTTEKGTCILSIINPVYSACYPVTRADGKFPRDEEWKIRYLDYRLRAYIQPWIEYNDDVSDFLSYSYHHTMSDYINAIVKSGFQIKEMLEPMPPAEWKENNLPRYYGYLETPTYAIFKCQK